MVVGLAAEDGHGAIDLLDDEEAHHLVGEGHARERELLVGAGVDLRREAVGAADGQYQGRRQVYHLLGYERGEFARGEFASALVEQQQEVGGGQGVEQRAAFELFLPLGGHALCRFHVGELAQLEGDIVGNARGVAVDGLAQGLIGGAPYAGEAYFHDFSI